MAVPRNGGLLREGTRSQDVSSSEKACKRLRVEKEEGVKRERNEIAVLSSTDFSPISPLSHSVFLSFLVILLATLFRRHFQPDIMRRHFPPETVRVAQI